MSRLSQSERLGVVQEHVRGLRSEASTNSESQRQLFRLGLIGGAAVFVVRKDLSIEDIQALLPIVPVIAMGITAFWAAETASILRLARGLTEAELKITEIAGESLVSYEEKYWKWRRKWLPRSAAASITPALVVSGGYYWSVIRLMSHSTLAQREGFALVIYGAALIAHLIAAIYVARSVGELRRNLGC